MKKWHKGLKVLAVVLTLFLAFPCSIVSAAAKPNIKIKHDPPKDYVPGFRITLDTEIKKKTDVLVARCYFKTKKDKNLVFVDMVPKGNPGYEATLPAPWVGSEYVEYAFVVVNKDKEVIRTQMFKMKERETAAATTWQEATEVKEIQLDKAQEAVERYEAVKKELEREYKDKLPKHQRVEAFGQLDVLTEVDSPAGQLKGFYDNMIVTTVADSQKYGVLAEGLYTPAEIAAAGGGSTITASTGAVTAGTISATGAIGLATIGLAALGVGGVAALAGGGGGGGGSSSHSDDSGGGGGTEGPPQDVTGTWNFQLKCQTDPQIILTIDIPFNETAGGDFNGSGSGTDVGGDPLEITISGNYNSSTNLMTGQITTTNQVPPRIDNFSTTLTSNDSGWVPTICVQACGCEGEIRLIKQ